MSAVAAAIGGAAVLGVGSAIIGGNAAQSAANTQAGAANNANATQLYMYNQNQSNMAPYLASGQQGLSELQSAMPDLTRQFTMNDFQQDPGYQFQLQQGEQAMQRSAAASGMLNSTGTEQNLNNYAQGMANTDYQQALSNFTTNQQQRYNMLSGMAGMGLGSATQLGNMGQQAANGMSAAQMASGNAQASGIMGQANAVSGGLGMAANGLQSGMMMNSLKPNPVATPTQPAMQGGYAGADLSSGMTQLA